MSRKKPKICVACGSGMATSHLIAQQLEELLREKGVKAEIKATKVSDLSKNEDYDLIVTSTLLPDTYSVPVIRATSFLTGVGMEKDLEKIIEYLEKIQQG